MSREYIGISGVVSQEQQHTLQEMFHTLGLHERRVLQLGIKATHKPQYLGVENKYGREWYPVGDEARAALASPLGTNTTAVAQVCFDNEHVQNWAYRTEFMRRSLGRMSEWLTGVQFDMLPWFDHPQIVQELTTLVSVEHIVLQCQGDIMKRASPEQVAEKLRSLPATDHILFDASGGRGIKMDPKVLLPYLEAVTQDPDLAHLRVAVGGGLNAQVVREELPTILRYFPEVSWDAEGQLHPVNHDGKRPLDMDAGREYFEACAEVLAEVPYNESDAAHEK